MCKEFYIIVHFPIFFLHLSPFIFRVYDEKKSLSSHITFRRIYKPSGNIMTIAQNARHEKYYVFVYNHIITIALSFPIWGFCTNLAHHYYIRRVISHTLAYIQQQQTKKQLRYDDNDVYVRVTSNQFSL